MVINFMKNFYYLLSVGNLVIKVFNKIVIDVEMHEKMSLSRNYVVNVVGKDHYEKIWSYP